MVAARATSAAQRTAGTAIAWCKPSWVLDDEPHDQAMVTAAIERVVQQRSD